MNGMNRIVAEPISTGRLALLPLRVEHAEEMAAVLADPDLHTFMGGAPLSPRDLRARYEGWAAGSPDPAVSWCNWVIRLRDPGCLAGTVQATITAEGPVAEVAWVVGTPWQGRGIATEAARALVAWLGQQQARDVIAHIRPGNRASAAVAAAAGLAPTGHWQDGERRWHLALAHSASGPLLSLLDRYRPQGEAEAADVERVRALASTAAADPWLRSAPLHVTASALIVHPATGRVLLRWHQRQQAWLQVGGHGDPGESDPLAIALREAAEETGLADLEPWPDAQLRHLVIVPVPASSKEPAHHHADLRFVLATQTPDAARPEGPEAPLRWLSPGEAFQATSEANLRETLSRAERLLAG
jgi:RimJ/RimL family protein N-acetyltransferase/8-oxo-dGTP pyrophosphatase MutT (NUDIX family)